FIFFLLSYTIFFIKGKFKNIYIVMLVLLVFFSLSRTSIVATIIIMLAYLIKNKKIRPINTIIVLFVFTFLFLILKDVLSPFIDGLALKNDAGSSGRVDIWKYVLVQDIFSNPLSFLFGNGYSYGNIEGLNLS